MENILKIGYQEIENGFPRKTHSDFINYWFLKVLKMIVMIEKADRILYSLESGVFFVLCSHAAAVVKSRTNDVSIRQILSTSSFLEICDRKMIEPLNEKTSKEDLIKMHRLIHSITEISSVFNIDFNAVFLTIIEYLASIYYVYSPRVLLGKDGIDDALTCSIQDILNILKIYYISKTFDCRAIKESNDLKDKRHRLTLLFEKTIRALSKTQFLKIAKKVNFFTCIQLMNDRDWAQWSSGGISIELTNQAVAYLVAKRSTVKHTVYDFCLRKLPSYDDNISNEVTIFQQIFLKILQFKSGESNVWNIMIDLLKDISPNSAVIFNSILLSLFKIPVYNGCYFFKYKDTIEQYPILVFHNGIWYFVLQNGYFCYSSISLIEILFVAKNYSESLENIQCGKRCQSYTPNVLETEQDDDLDEEHNEVVETVDNKFLQYKPCQIELNLVPFLIFCESKYDWKNIDYPTSKMEIIYRIVSFINFAKLSSAQFQMLRYRAVAITPFILGDELNDKEGTVCQLFGVPRVRKSTLIADARRNGKTRACTTSIALHFIYIPNYSCRVVAQDNERIKTTMEEIAARIREYWGVFDIIGNGSNQIQICTAKISWQVRYDDFRKIVSGGSTENANRGNGEAEIYIDEVTSCRDNTIFKGLFPMAAKNNVTMTLSSTVVGTTQNSLITNSKKGSGVIQHWFIDQLTKREKTKTWDNQEIDDDLIHNVVYGQRICLKCDAKFSEEHKKRRYDPKYTISEFMDSQSNTCLQCELLTPGWIDDAAINWLSLVLPASILNSEIYGKVTTSVSALSLFKIEEFEQIRYSKIPDNIYCVVIGIDPHGGGEGSCMGLSATVFGKNEYNNNVLACIVYMNEIRFLKPEEDIKNIANLLKTLKETFKLVKVDYRFIIERMSIQEEFFMKILVENLHRSRWDFNSEPIYAIVEGKPGVNGTYVGIQQSRQRKRDMYATFSDYVEFKKIGFHGEFLTDIVTLEERRRLVLENFFIMVRGYDTVALNSKNCKIGRDDMFISLQLALTFLNFIKIKY